MGRRRTVSRRWAGFHLRLVGTPAIACGYGWTKTLSFAVLTVDSRPSLRNKPSWELPVGKGKRWSLGPANWVLGGWTASGIYGVNSGRTFTAYGYTGPFFDEMGVVFNSRYRLNQSGSAQSGFTRSATEW